MKKYLICDFDSTIVSIEALDEIAKFVMHRTTYDADIAQKIEEITELGMQGKISFAQSLGMRLDLMSLHRNDIDEFKNVISKSITVSVDKNRDFIEKNKESFFIVSGGFRDLILPAILEAGFDEKNVYANELVYDAGDNVIGFDENNYLTEPLGKAQQVRQLKLEGYVIMVGDGWTDFEVKQEGAADDFVAFVEHVYRDAVVEQADYVAHNFDEVINYYKKK